LVSVVTGISLFALGITFNYMVTIFHKRPIRQGLLGKPVFKVPLNHHFGWIGTLALLGGIVLGSGSLIVGIGAGSGVEGIQRLWLYLLAAAMSTLVGVQLIIYWILLRVLEELGQRELLIQKDKGLG
jgi:hypothetical protein